MADLSDETQPVKIKNLPRTDFELCSLDMFKEGRKEGTCLFDINTKHNTEIYIGIIISGDSH